MSEDADLCYIVATVRDGDTLDDDVSPIAVLGPWTRDAATAKCAAMRAKYPARGFAVRAENEVEIDHNNGRVRFAREPS